ncbi:T9SS type A sorting domain-containing protein [Chryseobacterium sp. IT-36CA2]
MVKTVNVDTNSGRINVSELVKGTYLFTIVLEDNTKITKKVIKE